MKAKREKNNSKDKMVVAIVGQTASGKTGLSIKLAKKFNGEIVSADSRQVYRGLDIGSGKVTKKEAAGVPHHLLDVEDPNNTFTVEKFRDLGKEAIEKILSHKKLPIVVGGSGFYIDHLLQDVRTPNVPPDPKLRNLLSKKTAVALFEMLKKIDPTRAKNIDPKNKVRMIRAIEIAKKIGKVPPIKKNYPYKVLWIGTEIDTEVLHKKIRERLYSRVKKGMIAEAKKLHKRGMSYKRMDELGLEYRYLSRLLQNKLSKKEFLSVLEKEIRKYAKRQKTWFKRNKKIQWINFLNQDKAEKIVANFLKK